MSIKVFAATLVVATSALATLALATTAMAAELPGQQACGLSAHVVQTVQAQLSIVVQQNNGGIFAPNQMWSAIVDRHGVLCSAVVVGDAWPGSRAIAIAKAETANDFSNNLLALSTANLYAATQPGGSLYGLNTSNPFNPLFNRETTGTELGSGIGYNPGGIITFGGGVALYQNGQVIGGLGVSGDSSCADHTIAYRMRRAAHYDGIPGGATSAGTDNIEYPTGGAAPSGFQQPHCFVTDLNPASI